MRTLGVLVTLAAMSASCESSPIAGPTPPTVVENFTGVVLPDGLQSHAFETMLIGTVTITVTPAMVDGSASTARIGVGLGLPLNEAPFCAIVNGVAVSIGRSTRFESPIGPGEFCAAIYDTGELTGDVSYRMIVVHPL